MDTSAFSLRALLAYFSAAISLYWAWRFFVIVTPRLVEENTQFRGVYGHVGLTSWVLWAICSCLCYYCAGAIGDPTVRVAVVAVIGATWGAVLFVNFYYGWITEWYPRSLFW